MSPRKLRSCNYIILSLAPWLSINSLWNQNKKFKYVLYPLGQGVYTPKIGFGMFKLPQIFTLLPQKKWKKYTFLKSNLLPISCMMIDLPEIKCLRKQHQWWKLTFVIFSLIFVGDPVISGMNIYSLQPPL